MSRFGGGVGHVDQLAVEGVERPAREPGRRPVAAQDAPVPPDHEQCAGSVLEGAVLDAHRRRVDGRLRARITEGDNTDIWGDRGGPSMTISPGISALAWLRAGGGRTRRPDVAGGAPVDPPAGALAHPGAA